MPRKDLLDIESLDREEIDHLLDQSAPFKELFTRSVKKVPALKGKSVLMLFYEPSTRTHSSFEVAAKRLSADVTNFDVGQSSITKGESVRETVETLQAMRTDYVIVRHQRLRPARHHRPPHPRLGHQCRRRRPRPPHPGAARRLHHQGEASPIPPGKKSSSSATSCTPASPARRR